MSSLIVDNLTILFDEEDRDIIDNNKTWRIDQWGYFTYKEWNKETKKGSSKFFHQLIMLKHKLYDSSLVVDHINRNKLDNRKINLRMLSRANNSRNVGPKNKSKYKGVTVYRDGYKATIHRGKSFNAGIYSNSVEAAYAYNIAALNLPGAEYSYLNVIDEYISDERKVVIESLVIKALSAPKGSHAKSQSKYRGVCKIKPWVSSLKIGNKSITLGYYLSEEEAGEAYDIVAVILGRETANNISGYLNDTDKNKLLTKAFSFKNKLKLL